MKKRKICLTKIIGIRLSKEEARTLSRLAKRHKLNQSEMVRSLIQFGYLASKAVAS